MWRFAAVGALLLVLPRPARAEDPWGSVERAVKVLTVVELLVPDVRVEIPIDTGEVDDSSRWVLSWPIVVTSFSLYEYTGPPLENTDGRDQILGIRIAPYVEPQLRLDGTQARFAAVTRTTWYRNGVSPSLELGGVAGKDGAGGFAGLGVAIFHDYKFGPQIGIVARYVKTIDEERVDFALDMHLPFIEMMK